jgi:hypothetical protein
LTVQALKALCVEHRIPVSGRKPVLIDRIVAIEFPGMPVIEHGAVVLDVADISIGGEKRSRGDGGGGESEGDDDSDCGAASGVDAQPDVQERPKRRAAVNNVYVNMN